jgi:hypothetical protein
MILAWEVQDGSLIRAFFLCHPKTERRGERKRKGDQTTLSQWTNPLPRQPALISSWGRSPQGLTVSSSPNTTGENVQHSPSRPRRWNNSSFKKGGNSAACCNLDGLWGHRVTQMPQKDKCSRIPPVKLLGSQIHLDGKPGQGGALPGTEFQFCKM